MYMYVLYICIVLLCLYHIHVHTVHTCMYLVADAAQGVVVKCVIDL